MTTIQVRRGTAAAWTAVNPVLAAGELGFATDTPTLKIGDGTDSWGALTTAVAIVSSPNTFTAHQRIQSSAAASLLILDNTGATPGPMALSLNPVAGAIDITMSTDWSLNQTGQTTYDSIDITHRSAGDGVYVSHHGGVAQANCQTGSVEANNGITWVANPGMSGAAQNAVTVAYVASGASTPLSVSVVGSAITVNLQTDGSGAPISTAAQVIAAAVASVPVQALARAYPLSAPASGGGAQPPVTSAGTGTVDAMAAKRLAGAFTGPAPGAQTAFNSYVPLFNDDDGSGTGTVISYKGGARSVTAANGNPYSSANSIAVDHRAGQPAVLILNQFTGALNVAAASPADGAGMALRVIDFSTADSVNITRYEAPIFQSFANYPTSQGAVISVSCQTGVTNFNAIRVNRSGDSQGFSVRNDGTAGFGITTTPPFGRVWIEATNAGNAANALVLSNPSATTNSGARLNFVAGGVNHAQIFSNYATVAQNGSLTIQVLNANTAKQAVLIGPASALTVNGISAGATMVVNNGSTGGAIAVFQNNGTDAVKIINGGQIQFALASNEATGAGSAFLGANSPAVTNAAPYTWEKVTTSDGSQGYIPVWK